MKTTYRFLGSIIIGILLSSLLYIWFKDSSQPHYSGRSLWYWASTYFESSNNFGTNHSIASDAIRTMGTNCLPTALAWLQDKESAFDRLWRIARMKLGMRHYNFQYGETLQTQLGFVVITILGEDAKEIIPELTKLQKNGILKGSRYLSLLSVFGDSGIPALENSLNEKHLAENAAQRLVYYHTDSFKDITKLMTLAKHSTNSFIRYAAVYAAYSKLLDINQNDAFKLYIEGMNDSNSYVRWKLINNSRHVQYQRYTNFVMLIPALESIADSDPDKPNRFKAQNSLERLLDKKSILEEQRRRLPSKISNQNTGNIEK